MIDELHFKNEIIIDVFLLAEEGNGLIGRFLQIAEVKFISRDEQR